ncbi:MAG: hypothetical protein ABJO67_05230 [Pseudoruegeria sp.]
MKTQKIDLSALPNDQDTHRGYEEIHSVWIRLSEMLKEGNHPDDSCLNELVSKAQNAMTGREVDFMCNLQSLLSDDSVENRHARLTGGLYKVLMDRHGYKVSKDGGGLG